MRIALLLGLLAIAAPVPSMACSCGYLSPKRALAGADAVFAGRIEEVIQIERSDRLEERIIVRFSVGRVWKGDLGEQFTMHTFRGSSMCMGLEDAEVGEELLVFAFAEEGEGWKSFFVPSTRAEAERLAGPGSEREVLRQDLVDSLPDGMTIYTTGLCSGTRLWTKAGSFARALGPYRTPRRGLVMRDPPIDAKQAAGPDDVPYLCRNALGYLDKVEVVEPPVNSAELEEILSKNEQYKYGSTSSGYADRWWRDGEKSLALCRVPKPDAEACGGIAALFMERPESQGGKWMLSGLITDPCYDPQ